MNKVLPKQKNLPAGEAPCALCPRACGALWEQGLLGCCHSGTLPRVVRAAPHFYEEPALSGTKGSGTVFFSGCGLGCVFCQNRAISQSGATGREHDTASLAGVFLGLQAQGVHNLNLVTATHHRPAVLQALRLAKEQGLCLPVVWSTGGYEAPGAAAALAGEVDIHLADLKFRDPELSGALAGAPDYFSHASRYITEAVALTGQPRLDEDGLLQSGVVVRVLVLPGHSGDAIDILRWLAATLPKGGFLLSLMCQYTPPTAPGPPLPGALGRRLSTYEYQKVADAAVELGLTQGWLQDRASATEAYLPSFQL